MKTHRYSSLATAAVAAFLVPAVAAAQGGIPTQFERVKGLEPFIGLWRGETAEESEPDFLVNCRWTANKSYARFNFFARNEEERIDIGAIVVGWDGAEKKLALWAFFPEGQAKANPSIDGNTMTWTSTGTSAEGEETSADVKLQVDGEALTIEVRNSRRGEQDQPDMNLSFKRRPARARDAE